MEKEIQKTVDKVRVVIDVNRKMLKVYRKSPFIIPVIKNNGIYLTGQDLTERQMMDTKTTKGQILEREPLTEEQKKKYPYVIDPSLTYKVNHLDWLHKKDPYQNALWDLLVISGQFAENKSRFDEDPRRYVGYLEDAVGEAVANNNIRQERFEAELEVRSSSMDDYKRIALVLNFTVPNINVNVREPKDVLLNKLLECCDTHPKQVKMCFPKYNKGIEKDIFILECIDAGFIKRSEKNDLFFDGEWIGKSIEDVKVFLSKRGNERVSSKLGKMLDEKNGITTPSQSVVGEVNIITECKAAIFDGRLDEARKLLSKVDKENQKFEYENLESEIVRLEKLQSEKVSKQEVDKFVKELKDLPIDKIQGKISHVNSKYNESECKMFWDDKERLIEYMVSVKFKK